MGIIITDDMESYLEPQEFLHAEDQVNEEEISAINQGLPEELIATELSLDTVPVIAEVMIPQPYTFPTPPAIPFPYGGTAVPWDEVRIRWGYATKQNVMLNFEQLPDGAPVTKRYQSGGHISAGADVRKNQYTNIYIYLRTIQPTEYAISLIRVMRKLYVKNGASSRTISFYVRSPTKRYPYGGAGIFFPPPAGVTNVTQASGYLWIYGPSGGPAVTSERPGMKWNTPAWAGGTKVFDWEVEKHYGVTPHPGSRSYVQEMWGPAQDPIRLHSFTAAAHSTYEILYYAEVRAVCAGKHNNLDVRLQEFPVIYVS